MLVASVVDQVLKMEFKNIEESLSELRENYRDGITRGFEWRKSQLEGILNMVVENEKECFVALHEDLGKGPVEAYKDEIGPTKKAIEYALSNLKKWMAPKKVGLPLFFFPSKGEIIPEPYGLVLIISSWNYPIDLALEPLVGAIAAGNTVVIKPAENASACSSFLANMIPRYLDKNAVRVIEGGVDVSQELLQHKWDKIFFTGSTRVGRAIMIEAAKHLTPVTLELGGKCPAVFDFGSISPSDLKVSMMRIVAGKWVANCGQACVAIDYLIVEEKFASSLIDSLKKTLKRFYGGDGLSNSSDVNHRVVNRHHFGRLCDLLEEPKVKYSIVHGGSYNPDKLMMEPTILLDPPLNSEVMTEEIFGPILPIITVNNIYESVEFIKSRPKPLAIYAFTNNQALRQRIVSDTSSGSVIFNDAIIQYICDQLPFGGVGASGNGRYHGKYSFDVFSHEKAVMHRGFFPEIAARYPPWNNYKFNFIRLAYSFDYLGLLLLMLGLKRIVKTN